VARGGDRGGRLGIVELREGSPIEVSKPDMPDARRDVPADGPGVRLDGVGAAGALRVGEPIGEVVRERHPRIGRSEAVVETLQSVAARDPGGVQGAARHPLHASPAQTKSRLSLVPTTVRRPTPYHLLTTSLHFNPLKLCLRLSW
jgi:hypothetical protein